VAATAWVVEFCARAAVNGLTSIVVLKRAAIAAERMMGVEMVWS
jgi:hypothetical protein